VGIHKDVARAWSFVHHFACRKPPILAIFRSTALKGKSPKGIPMDLSWEMVKKVVAMTYGAKHKKKPVKMVNFTTNLPGLTGASEDPKKPAIVQQYNMHKGYVDQLKAQFNEYFPSSPLQATLEAQVLRRVLPNGTQRARPLGECCRRSGRSRRRF
jgi:hypothetical protein